MKTKNNIPGAIKSVIIISAIVGLQINMVFSSVPVRSDRMNSTEICVPCINGNLVNNLAPATPAEATFADESSDIEINLAPITPAEASFDDNSQISDTINPLDLAPVTPAEADFND